MAYGRPMKNKTRRVPVTVHISTGMLDVVDQYVEDRKASGESAYSRSDFYNEAATAFLKSIGIDPDEESERNKNVPEKSEAKAK